MKKILPVIWQSQTQYIQNLLGTPLYKDLLSKVEAETITGDDLILVNDYIADTLLYYVQFELQIPLLFNFRNKSTATNNSQWSNPIGTKELSRIENRMKDKAEFFAKRITEYLCANSVLFPLYTTFTTSDEVRPQPGSATVSVFLNDTIERKCNRDFYG